LQNQKKAYIYALTAIFLWSTVASAFKIALSVLSTEIILFYASISASLVLFIFYYFDSDAPRIQIKDLQKSITPSFFNPFIYYLVLFEAYDRLPAQIAQPLNYTWPIILSIFSAFVFHEKIKPIVWIGFLISFIGVIIISSQNSSTYPLNTLGIILALSSSIIWSIYWIINMKDTRKDSLKLFLNFSMGSLFILIYILIKGVPFEFSTTGLLASFYIGLFEMGITFFIWLKALNLATQTSKINHLVFLSPFLSFIFIAFVLKENIEWTSIIGLLVIILGIISQKIVKQ